MLMLVLVAELLIFWKNNQSSKRLERKDIVVVIAGANKLSDIAEENPHSTPGIIKDFHSLVSENVHRNIAFVTQLYQHHLAWNNSINKKVFKINHDPKKIKLLNISDYFGHPWPSSKPV